MGGRKKKQKEEKEAHRALKNTKIHLNHHHKAPCRRQHTGENPQRDCPNPTGTQRDREREKNKKEIHTGKHKTHRDPLRARKRLKYT
jgi:hypothetical protein